MKRQRKRTIGKLVAGAMSGMVIGVIGLCLLWRGEPPVEFKLLLTAMLLGAFFGAVIAVTAGGRSVSVFWPNLVLIFGIITIIPWWYYPKTHAYLPLGTAYVNQPTSAVLWRILLPHILISIVLAGALTALYKKLAAESDKQDAMEREASAHSKSKRRRKMVRIDGDGTSPPVWRIG